MGSRDSSPVLVEQAVSDKAALGVSLRYGEIIEGGPAHAADIGGTDREAAARGSGAGSSPEYGRGEL